MYFNGLKKCINGYNNSLLAIIADFLVSWNVWVKMHLGYQLSLLVLLVISDKWYCILIIWFLFLLSYT